MEKHNGRPLNFTPVDLKTCTLDCLGWSAWDLAMRDYKSTVEHFRKLNPEGMTPSQFWREYVWGVYTSGFNAKVVSGFIDEVLGIYGSWDDEMHYATVDVWRNISMHIANRRKFNAIIWTKEVLQQLGWVSFRNKYLYSVDAMQQLPFVGKVTKYHLARNLGYDVVKPDLHLERLAKRFDKPSSEDLCKSLTNVLSERIGVIDYMLWNYCAAFGTAELA